MLLRWNISKKDVEILNSNFRYITRNWIRIQPSERPWEDYVSRRSLMKSKSLFHSHGRLKCFLNLWKSLSRISYSRVPWRKIVWRSDTYTWLRILIDDLHTIITSHSILKTPLLNCESTSRSLGMVFLGLCPGLSRSLSVASEFSEISRISSLGILKWSYRFFVLPTDQDH